MQICREPCVLLARLQRRTARRYSSSILVPNSPAAVPAPNTIAPGILVLAPITPPISGLSIAQPDSKIAAIRTTNSLSSGGIDGLADSRLAVLHSASLARALVVIP